MRPVGIEPTSMALQTTAMTTSAKVALVPSVGIEPTTSALSRRYSTAELTRQNFTEHYHESIPNILLLTFFSPLIGAARENRTLNFCLEGSGFTIKLQPHYATFNPLYLSAAYDAANAFGFTSGTTLQVPRI